MTRKIVVVGSNNIDLVVSADRLPVPGETIKGNVFSSHLGGKGGNQAVAAARAGAEVAMIGRIGSDAFGLRILGGLAADGIDTSALIKVEEPSGVALIVTAGEANMIVVAPGANDCLVADQVDAAHFKGAFGVLAQLETPIEGVICSAELSRSAGAWFMLDPAPARALPDSFFRLVDWLTPNESEARALLGLPDGPVDGLVAARLLRERGVGGVAVKLGERGIVLSYGCEEPIIVPALKVAAIDTTAAGDVFNGAFAAALADGAPPLEAARFGIAAAALCVTKLGAQSSIPFKDEIERMCGHERTISS